MKWMRPPHRDIDFIWDASFSKSKKNAYDTDINTDIWQTELMRARMARQSERVRFAGKVSSTVSIERGLLVLQPPLET